MNNGYVVVVYRVLDRISMKLINKSKILKIFYWDFFSFYPDFYFPNDVCYQITIKMNIIFILFHPEPSSLFLNLSLFSYTCFVAYFLFTGMLYSAEIMLKIICSVIYKVHWVFISFFYDCPSLF